MQQLLSSIAKTEAAENYTHHPFSQEEANPCHAAACPATLVIISWFIFV